MTIGPGLSLSNFRIVDALGEGGMGQVWRAEDEKLGREVALKVLPEGFANDPERMARFEREAKVLASLNHPNIATLYGLESVVAATPRPAAETAAPQGPRDDAGAVEGHASRVPGGGVESSETGTGTETGTGRVGDPASSIQHPASSAAEITFLVMELVEGEDLSERVKRGPVPIEEAVPIARQIAEGLEAAHERGIVHRDLKPANIKIRPDGTVKVLDFGLAKAWQEEGPDPGLSLSPTVTRHATAAGLILGTAAYMSPEQAAGKAADRRADIWSFGVVLWEMLTGHKLFEGETVSHVLASVLKDEVDVAELPPGTPARLRGLIERCLERDARHRLQAIGEARIALGVPFDEPEVAADVPRAGGSARPSRFVQAAGWALAALALAAIGLLLWQRPGSGDNRVLRTSIPPAADTAFHLPGIAPGPAALSPDGARVVFAGRDAQGAVRLYLRALDQPEAIVLSGTEGAQYPFWSPDSRWVAFFSSQDATLKKVDANGGPPITLCEAPNGKGGSWGAEGDIVFAPDADTPLHRVSSAGGQSEAITEIDRSRFNSHRHPRFLPGGRRFLYVARGINAPQSTVMVGSLDGDVERELMRSIVQAEYANGYLFFIRDQSLMAQPFNASDLELLGEATPVAEGALSIPAASIGIFSVSPEGLLAYHSGEVNPVVTPVWLDRAGREVARLGDPGEYNALVLSPDGESAAFTVTTSASGTFDIWTYDLGRDLRTRFTFDEGVDFYPVWSPDGESIAFSSNRSGSFALYRMGVGGVRGEELLLESDGDLNPTGWSPDGRWLIYMKQDDETDWDLWALPLEGGGEPQAVRAQPGLDAFGSLSPDGRWMTYFSNESGSFEVYVMPFPGAGRRWQVSTGSGLYPVWCADGREIVYQQVDGRLMSAEIELGAESVRLGDTTPLFDIAPPENIGSSFAPSPDCERFLVIPRGSVSDTTLLNLVVNWPQVLEER